MSERAEGLAALDYAILQQCMHCGLCLSVCPTYAETHRERNSPRGRIALMRAIADGELPVSPVFAEEMSYCLGCLACTTACPAGVDYAHMVEVARNEAERRPENHRRWGRRLLRWAVFRQMFMRPGLLRAVGRALWVYQASGLQRFVRASGLLRLLPKRLRDLEPATPPIQSRFSDQRIRLRETAARPRYRVAVLTGCVQDMVFADVNRATVDVLVANDCDVFTPPAQPCCGSIHAHNGEEVPAQEQARRLIDLLPPEQFDAIISNAAGCGSHLKHYGRLLAHDPRYANRAHEWSRKLKDISEWMVEIGFRKPTAQPADEALAVTYHEACHLCHGQKISEQPRTILRSLPGVELREAEEATWCCGSAGTYSVTQPETAGWLRERKLKHLKATGAALVAAANPGCILHLQTGIALRGDNLKVIHPVVLLAQAYGNEKANEE